MAAEESNIVNSIMKDISPHGVRLFRNVRGQFYTMDSVKRLMAAAISLNANNIRQAIKELRQLSAGLQAAGSSDLIGFKPIVVTQDMVGRKIAVLVAVEVKTLTGKVAPEQLNFVNFVRENGGYAGIARSPEDARKIIDIIC